MIKKKRSAVQALFYFKLDPYSLVFQVNFFKRFIHTIMQYGKVVFACQMRIKHL